MSCYLNTDYMEQGELSRGLARAARQKPRHVMWDLVLTNNDNKPTFALCVNDKAAYEALAGPLSLELWDDVPTLQGVDFGPLESGATGFSEWYAATAKAYQCDEPFFTSPVAKAFYRWAGSGRDEKYWFERAERAVANVELGS